LSRHGAVRADLDGRDGGLGHRQHEVRAERRLDDRHDGWRQHRDPRGGRCGQHLHLRADRSGGRRPAVLLRSLGDLPDRPGVGSSARYDRQWRLQPERAGRLPADRGLAPERRRPVLRAGRLSFVRQLPGGGRADVSGWCRVDQTVDSQRGTNREVLQRPDNPAVCRRGLGRHTSDGRVMAGTDKLGDLWVDRDLGWLEFNRRVLAEAEDARTLLLERLKYLAIFTSNLDEFFMKRIAALRVAHERDGDGSQARLLKSLRAAIVGLLEEQRACLARILPEIEGHGVRVLSWNDLSEGQRAEATDFFTHHVSPALTPQVVDAAHPAPFLSNLSL